jgi:hypothetical protein
MGTDTRLLMGEVIENPEGQERNTEFLLLSFIRALIEEQRLSVTKDQVRDLDGIQFPKDTK